MKAPEWKQRVLLLTSDKEIEEKISAAFGTETQLHIAKNHTEAFALLEANSFHVMIVDDVTLETKPHSEKEKPPSVAEMCQCASQLNQQLTIVLLVHKLLAKEGDFARKSGANLIMNRNDLSVNRMIYVIQIMRKRTFRTLLGRDIPLNAVLPVDVWHYMPMSKRYLVFLQAGDIFTETKKQKLSQTHVHHLFVKETDLGQLDSLNLTYSKELSSIRYQYQQLLSQFFNFSSEGHLHFGLKVFKLGMEIVASLEKLIDSFDSDYECLEELPYPRWSTLAHGINCAIYAIIFSKICKLSPVNEIAFAALIHNVGLSDVNQKLLNRREGDFSPAQLKEYKTHVARAIEMSHAIQIPLTPLMESILISHHENYDGTGFPSGLAGTLLPFEPGLMSIIGNYDYFNSVHPGTHALDPYEAWGQLKELNATSTRMQRRFHPTLLAAIDQFFQNARDTQVK